MTRSVGVVVPAYRPDVDRLAAYIDALTETLAPETVRVELDAPTPEVVEATSSLPATVNVSPVRRGKGAAVTAGFEALSTDVRSFVDADGSTPAESFAAVLAPVLDDDADLSVGSRRHPEATVTAHQTLARRRLGDGFAWLAKRLLDAELYDYQCGAKAMTAEAWTDVRGHLYEPGFAWDVELVAVAAASNHALAEVPVEWEDRPGSTVSPVRTSFDLARSLLSARHRAKLIREDRLHALLDARRSPTPSLVERLGIDPVEE
ncbi:dolichol-P-glucose transferase [Haloprofundus marisrubri]|uniref:Dolichol-P-glucose transferase n=1 Tax=Haloprofundus marisrubri TaxID=1514971 RepID=A0A0W1R8Y1_9EURY|nr:glycosyltransferase [Haloprofundus marisrubri]KTG09754.1 dolichol-P-glucose transferase [Haloprofundus marisrubri]